MRNPRYKVSFGYVCPKNHRETLFGKLEEKMMNKNDVEFMLRVISPLDSDSWLNVLSGLGRGSDMRLPLYENTAYGRLVKVLKIERN